MLYTSQTILISDKLELLNVLCHVMSIREKCTILLFFFLYFLDFQVDQLMTIIVGNSAAIKINLQCKIHVQCVREKYIWIMLCITSLPMKENTVPS